MAKQNFNQKNLASISNNFLTEIEKSRKGIKTSLWFIIHQLSPTPLVKEGENFEVLVIGGSVLKKALIKKTKNGIKILKIENEKNIYFDNENDFLDIVLKELYPEIKVLALNFAYPLKPMFENGKLDGVLLGIGKEGRFHGLISKKVGLEIETYLWEKERKKISVAVANDTICLLLSGLMKYSFENLAAGIIGTGLNFALFLGKNKLINLESANFDKFPQSQEGKIIDKESAKPSRALFEKETAGSYLYKHFNLIIKAKDLKCSPVSSTKDLNEISLKHILHISSIARNLIKRSAQLVACQIAGITGFKKQDMVFNMEGSLFWKGNNYKETVEKTVKQLVPEYKVKFVEIENSAIFGAAKLVI